MPLETLRSLLCFEWWPGSWLPRAAQLSRPGHDYACVARNGEAMSKTGRLWKMALGLKNT